MKKILLTAALVALLSTPALAKDPKTYVGFDLQGSLVNFDTISDGGGGFIDGDRIFEDTLWGANLHFGSRFHEYFGAEFGGFYNLSKDNSVAAGAVVGPGPTVAGVPFTTDLTTWGFTLDGLAYLPLNETVELLATAGVSWTKAEADFNAAGVAVSADEDEFGARGGFGIQFNVTENVDFRGIARYQTADFEGLAKDMWTLSLGMNYGF